MTDDGKKRIAEAYGEVLDRQLEERLSGSAEEHVFSSGFEQRMDKLIKRSTTKKELNPRLFRRIALVAAAVVLALCTAVCALAENKRFYGGIHYWRSGKFAELTYPQTEKKSIEEEYALTEVPEGFRLIKKDKSDMHICTEYDNGKGKNVHIYLKQFVSDAGGCHIDNQHGFEITERTIAGRTVCVIQTDRGTYTAWLENGYIFRLNISSPVDDETLARLIGAVQITE